MKKLLIKVLPAVVLALTLCLAIAMLAACGSKSATFTGNVTIMGQFETECTLELKSDNTSDYSIKIANEGETFRKIEQGMAKTGTWKMENDQYVVTLGEGDDAKTLTSTYDEESKTYTIEYGMVGDAGIINVKLTYTK